MMAGLKSKVGLTLFKILYYMWDQKPEIAHGDMLCYLLSVPFCVFIEKQIRHNTEHINNNNILISVFLFSVIIEKRTS